MNKNKKKIYYKIVYAGLLSLTIILVLFFFQLVNTYFFSRHMYFDGMIYHMPSLNVIFMSIPLAIGIGVTIYIVATLYQERCHLSHHEEEEENKNE